MLALSPDSRTFVPTNTPPALGVLVCEREGAAPFAEGAYIRRLSAVADRIGFALVAFAPWTWDARGNSVRGWVWNKREQRWTARARSLPRVVYDRAWPASEAERRRFQVALRRLREAVPLTFLNGRLPHKGKVGELLAREPEFAALVPPTAPYAGTKPMLEWLNRHGGSAFLKPAAGSQGRRAIACSRASDGTVALAGRTGDNRPFTVRAASETEALGRLHRWIGSRAYIMQPLLSLHTEREEPFDLRALLQKNARGRWTITGIAARVGASGTMTANLHGGGRAHPARRVLEPLLGEKPALAVEHRIRETSLRLAGWIEETFGRFAEIGLDFGVDRSGRLWFLEANSKPGRTAMGSAGDEAARRAVEQPMSYASTILLRQSGRVFHEFDDS
ncbi:YheC/YheD family protein [Cohnella sp. GCM10027633]|uniref:YheC/YheD family endospore coat-associated protein n=1 Tax=unclassified Cohnella TaxID=2636738 RepID=UPI003634B08B